MFRVRRPQVGHRSQSLWDPLGPDYQTHQQPPVDCIQQVVEAIRFLTWVFELFTHTCCVCGFGKVFGKMRSKGRWREERVRISFYGEGEQFRRRRFLNILMYLYVMFCSHVDCFPRAGNLLLEFGKSLL